MKRDVLNEDDDDEVCRVTGNAAIVLCESDRETKRAEIARLLQRIRHHRVCAERDEQRMLEHAIRLVRP